MYDYITDNIVVFFWQWFIVIVATLVPTYFLFVWSHRGESLKKRVKIYIIWICIMLIFPIMSFIVEQYTHWRTPQQGGPFLIGEVYEQQKENERKAYFMFPKTEEEKQLTDEEWSAKCKNVRLFTESLNAYITYMFILYFLIGVISVPTRIIMLVHKSKKIQKEKKKLQKQ